MKLSLNISSCPNDTFMFHALLHGLVDTEGLEFEANFADIEELNRLASEGVPDVCKVSCAVLPQIAGRYRILDSGGALGYGNGPLLVSAGEVDIHAPGLRVAVPGMHTTANLLLDRLFPALTDRTPVLFSEIARRVADGGFDAGVLIHEGRFTYTNLGLRLVADLGEEWARQTSLLLPLGAIAAARRLVQGVAEKVARTLRRSVAFAMENPEISTGFVASHARELSPEVIRAHIALFVNEHSLSLGVDGRRAIAELTGLTDSEVYV